MRFDPVLDSLYVLGSLWGALTGPQVCSSNANSVARAVHTVVRSPLLGVSADVTAFVDVTVIPMDTERALPNHTVLVAGGRITALGPVTQVPVPPGAVRIDGRGKYLMPGLGDMHFGPGHALSPPPIGAEQAFADALFIRYAAHGVTALRSLDGSSPADVQQWRHIAAEFSVPRMYLALPRIPRLSLSQPDSVAAVIAAINAAGYSHVDADNSIHNNAIQIDSLTLTALRQGGLPVTTHRHGMSFASALKLGSGNGSVQHLYVFWDSLLGVPGPAATVDLTKQPQPVDLPIAKVPALAVALKRAGVWITPSLECMQLVHPYIKDNALAQVVKALQDAGVRMLLGSDGWALQGSVHSELVALVRAGLTPYQALLTGTRNVAEYFALLDSVGTVAVGKWADLVLLPDNPLQNVRHTWEPAGVMLGGRWFDRVALDQRLLASPRFWFEELLRSQMPGPLLAMPGILPYMSSPARSLEQWDDLARRGQRILALVDSLDRANRQEHGRVLPLVAAELGGIRARMTPDERDAFDVQIRVWLRAQARHGHAVAIAGISSTP